MTNNKPPFYQDENPKPIFWGYEDTDDSVDELDLFDMLDEEEE